MTESRWQVETGMKDMSNSSASSSLNQVDGGVIHVTDRSHKYNAGWYRDEFAPVRFMRERLCMDIFHGGVFYFQIRRSK